MRSYRPFRQRGAALLTAMLTVTLVATFAAAALWQQWRATEIEAAERARIQSAWVLIGALDWTRLILREDARAGLGGGADHLAEPWAVPLEEARLSTFLAADKNIASDALEGLPDAFLSGRIVDAQSRLNVLNLVDSGKPVQRTVDAFTKLFELLGLPTQELGVMVANLQRALPAGAVPSAGTPSGTPGGNPTGTPGTAAAPRATLGTAPTPAGAGAPPAAPASAPPTADVAASGSVGGSGPLLPQHTEQLTWLGLSPGTAAALAPYVTILPVRTALNINTASAEALFASVPALDLAGAKRLVAQRSRGFFRNLTDAAALVPESAAQFAEGQHSVSSRFFEVFGRLRLDNTWVEERSLVRRDGIEVRIVWRERGAGATAVPPRS